MRSLVIFLFSLFVALTKGHTMDLDQSLFPNIKKSSSPHIHSESDSETLLFSGSSETALLKKFSGHKTPTYFVSGSGTSSQISSYQSSPLNSYQTSPTISNQPSSANLNVDQNSINSFELPSGIQASEKFSTLEENKLYGLQPVIFSNCRDESIFREIDRDFFSRSSTGWCTHLFQGVRVLTAIGIGVLVSMPVTGQDMILIGDWVGALVDSSAAYILVTYIAATTTFCFADIWDDWFKDMGKVLHPIYVECVSKKEEARKEAFYGKFPSVVEKKNLGDYCKLGMYTLSSGAYAFPLLWQLLWSAEEISFPQLGYVTMPLFFFSMGRVFYITAIQNLKRTPSSKGAREHKEILKNSIMKFKERMKTNDNLRSKVYMKLTMGNTSQESLFSYLFFVHSNASEYCTNDRLYRLYVKEIDIPHIVEKKDQIKSTVNGFLGLGWLTASNLYTITLQSFFTKAGTKSEPAYWISLAAATVQTGNFIKVTSPIFHTTAQTLASPLFVSKTKENLTTPQEIVDDEPSSCDCNTSSYRNIARGYFGLIRDNITRIPALVTAGILALPELKRGLEAYASSRIPNKIIGAGIPYLVGTQFFTSVFGNRTGSIYRKIMTNLPFCCYKSNDCCTKAHELETLDMYADNALKMVENDFSEQVLQCLVEDILLDNDLLSTD